MKYPFIPKSTSYIEPGQIWAIRLSNGMYACGVVLAKLIGRNGVEKRSFYAGLLGWCDKSPPTPENINSSGLLKKGALHVKAISNIESEIIGKAVIEDLPPNPIDFTDDIVSMGYNVLNIVAEKHFVKQIS